MGTLLPPLSLASTATLHLSSTSYVWATAGGLEPPRTATCCCYCWSRTAPIYNLHPSTTVLTTKVNGVGLGQTGTSNGGSNAETSLTAGLSNTLSSILVVISNSGTNREQRFQNQHDQDPIIPINANWAY